MNKMSLQFKTKCRISETAQKTEMLTFSFFLGPLKVVCLANIPREGEEEAVVYVKLELHASKLEWEIKD